MISTTPQVFLVARPAIEWEGVSNYLRAVAGEAWMERATQSDSSAAEALVEFMGRLCYRSWEPGLNPNVTKIRTDAAAYIDNILRSAHGSVLEHASYSFVFYNVSRVFTHELVRHRAGTAISQESLRYVRLTELPFAHPEFVREDEELSSAADQLLQSMEAFQELAASRTGIAEPGTAFADKKTVTSAMRRYAPEGVSTSIGWTANVRALRHIVAMRTDVSAEVEIRAVFDQVASILKAEAPLLFADFERHTDGSWKPQYPKV